MQFVDVWKSYRSGMVLKPVISGLTLDLPTDRNIAVVGRNGIGKSTLLKLIAGTLRPSRGTIIRPGRTSWPLGFIGGLHPNLTGRQNARFIARIYGADADDLIAYVEDFAEIGRYFDRPVRTYSHGMRARVAFGVSMAIDFQCYLVDEVIGVGDARFREKCREIFRSKLSAANLIMVSHSEGSLREFCQSALVMSTGRIDFYDDIEQGLEAYRLVENAV